MSEGDERFVHRLEAFSDIVIGFTLAQLGAQLVVSGHPGSLAADPVWFLNFLWTFAIVCGMWWLHNRMFRIFSPTMASVIANFGLLASIVILVYFAEEMSHAATIADFIVGQRLYDGALAVCSLLVAFLTHTGFRERRDELTPQQQFHVRAVTLVNIVAACCLFAVIAMSLLPVVYTWSPMLLGFGIPLAYLVVGSGVGRFILRRELRTA